MLRRGSPISRVPHWALIGVPIALLILAMTLVWPGKLPEYMQDIQPVRTSPFETVYQIGPPMMEEIKTKLESEMHSSAWSDAGSIDYTDSWENYVSGPFMDILWTDDHGKLQVRVVRRNAIQAIFRSGP